MPASIGAVDGGASGERWDAVVRSITRGGPDGEGMCTADAQASSREEEERVKANVRSCAFKRPTMEAQGLIWAWGEGGKDAETEAMMTPPLLVGEIEGIGKSGRAACGGFRNHWQVRDLPVRLERVL